MKKLLTLLFTLFTLSSTACHNVSIEATDYTDNGDGTYTYTIELCAGEEDSWGFYLDFGTANLVSFEDSIYNSNTDTTITGDSNGDGDLEYGDWDDDTNAEWVDGDNADQNPCFTFTVTTDQAPGWTLTVDGLQPNYCPPGPGCGCSDSFDTTPLPVELLTFETDRDVTEVKITWITASERHSDHFELIKRTKDSHWVTIDKLDAQGTSVERTEYTSYDNSQNTTYYKLLQYDRDGEKYVYGPIVSKFNRESRNIKKIINIQGQEVNENYKGLKFYIYE